MAKYSEIRNIKDLEGARLSVRKELEAEPGKIRASLKAARDAYSPSRLVASAIHSASSDFPFDRLLLLLIGLLKRRR